MKLNPGSTVLSCLLFTAVLPAWASPESPRSRIRFDADWKFHRDPIQQVVKSTFTWHWRPATSGVSLNDDQCPTDFDADPGKAMSVTDDLFHNRRGYAWLWTDIGTGPSRSNLALRFSGVDDNAAVFLNGKKLLVHRGYGDPFNVRIDGAWNPNGPNRLVVLIQNTGGPGGLTGDVDFLRVTTMAPLPKRAQTNFDDSTWRTVHLPHDYVVEGTFDRHADAGHGSLPTTTAWYRKTFTLPESDRGKSIWIDFDGIYRDSKVWLNGQFLGEHPSGYTGFRHDISNQLLYGKPNTLAVYVDPKQQEGWWYEGGGIYRHVWLNVAGPVHVAPDTTFVRATPQGTGRLTTPETDVAIDTVIANQSDKVEAIKVQAFVTDSLGHESKLPPQSLEVAANSHATVKLRGVLHHAHLWSIEDPHLYTVSLRVIHGSRVLDEERTHFGVRSIRFDVEKGFFLNGRHVKIQGVCNHQDHAGVGIAVPDSLQYWRISQLKKMGANAYRMSHNPPAPELLDACDRLGMIVMDENRHLGDTPLAKSPHGTTYDDLGELKSMLYRDRNHPSIVMWSMCNEESLQGDPEGGKIFAAMQALTHKIDPTRPVTCAMSGGWDGGIAPVEDLLGINYSPWAYDVYHKKYPAKPIFGSETGSTVSTRGIYKNDPIRGYVSAYDINVPGWAQTAEVEWSSIATRPFVAGGYVWTGFDYKGEPTPYGWPCINSHFGIMDICGFPKDNYYFYQAWWGDKPLVHLLPHWNWSGREGQPIDVWAYTNGDQIELFLNGKSLGKQTAPEYGHVSWKVPYQAGVLVAKSYKHGRLFATTQVSTTGPAAAIRLTTDRTKLMADGEDLSEVFVSVVDQQGRVVPISDALVTFRVTGAGEVRGVGNGDPSSHEPDKANQRHAFNGRCMALVGAFNRPGRIELTVTSPGLKPAKLEFESHQ